MILLGLDPGPEHSGLVLYDITNTPFVVAAQSRIAWADVRTWVREHRPYRVVCERTQAGPPSTQVVRTTEVIGRCMELCDQLDQPAAFIPRRDVLQALGCATKGNKDALVRQALIELHGGDKARALGDRRKPGPLYGVTSHAWAALAIAVTYNIQNGGRYHVSH